MKRAISFILATVLSLGVFTMSASAAPEPDHSPAQTTFTMKGREASASIRGMLEEEGIPVKEDTVIQLVPSSSPSSRSADSGNDGNVLVITNQEGTTVRQDSLLLVTNDGIGFKDMNEVMARESFPHDEKLDKILVHGVAFYENYTDGLIYYRPLEMHFYYKKYQKCNVESIAVSYNCSGTLYEYPGYIQKQTDYTHSISLSQPNPVELVTYENDVKPLAVNRVIGVSSGSTGEAGQHLNHIIKIDGKTYRHNVPLVKF